MNYLSDLPQATDSNLSQVVAREAYFRLRENLVILQSASDPDIGAIEKLVKDLEQAQLRYKAAHGLIGNNPLGDAPEEDANRQNFSRDRPK